MDQKQTILILAANPKDTTRSRLNEELREIEDGLERAKNRDQFDLEYKLAVRPRDIQRAMLDLNPQIVHFSGHGAGDEGLIFEDETGQTKLVDGEALAGLFELFPQVECVVLNGCYSEIQAVAIAQHVKYVIGMKKAIGDKAAIEFAVGFYDALGSGQSVEFAYKLACAAIGLAGIKEELTPILKKKSIQSLLKILTDLNDTNVTKDIKNAYRICSPKDWKCLDTVEPEKILANIKTMRPGNSEDTRVKRFVACLVACTKTEELKQRLMKWADDEHINDFLALVNEEEKKLEEIKKNQNPYLIVKLRPSTQDYAKKFNKEDCYFVDAWFIGDGDTFHYKENPDYELVVHNKNEESFTLKEIREELIIDFINEIAQKIEDFNLHKLTIEIFMPLDLIKDEAVDLWKIEDGLDDDPPKLGTDYKVVVRLSERIMPNPRYIIPKKHWIIKWNNLQSRIKNSEYKGLMSLECDDLNQLKKELGKEDTIGVNLQKIIVQAEKKSVFINIFRCGIPIALWLRCDPSAECKKQIDCCSIQTLTETVKELRCDDHHIGLLWDDPYRLPPDINYSM